MRVQTQHKRDEQVMRVPERLEGLLPDLRMRGRIHEEHAQEHDVAGDAAGLRIVDLESDLWPNLGFLDVEEAGLWR